MPFHLERTVYYLDKYPDRIDLMSANATRRLRSTGEAYQESRAPLDGTTSGRLEKAWLFDASNIFDIVYERGVLTFQTIVLKAECLQSIRFREELPPGPEDRFLQLELAAAGYRMAHLSDVHLTYWAHGDNLTVCGGVSSPRKLAELHKSFQAAIHLMLNTFTFNKRQRRELKERRIQQAFWQIGYNGHLQLGEYLEARRWFLQAIRGAPWRPRYWQVFLGSYVKQFFQIGVKGSPHTYQQHLSRNPIDVAEQSTTRSAAQ